MGNAIPAETEYMYFDNVRSKKVVKVSRSAWTDVMAEAVKE